jgi:hypothetical protein
MSRTQSVENGTLLRYFRCNEMICPGLIFPGRQYVVHAGVMDDTSNRNAGR